MNLDAEFDYEFNFFWVNVEIFYKTKYQRSNYIAIENQNQINFQNNIQANLIASKSLKQKLKFFNAKFR